jgi:hypothetical protein
MLSDLDLNIAASTGIEDLNIADSAYDSTRGTVWAVDTEYGLLKLDLIEKTFTGAPVERLEGGLVAVAAANDGGAFALTQRDGCIVKFDAELNEVASFAARGAFGITASSGGVTALFLNNGRIEVAKLDENGKEAWRTSIQDVAGFPRGFRGTRLFTRQRETIAIVGDPKLQIVTLDEGGVAIQRIAIELPGGTSGDAPSTDGHVHYPVSGRGREEYLLGAAVDPRGSLAAVLYRAPGQPQRTFVLLCPLSDPEAAPKAHAVVDNIDQFGGFDGERLICIGGVPGHSHGRIFTLSVEGLETIDLDQILELPAKRRWWDKYRLIFNVGSEPAVGDETAESLRNYGGEDVRY